MQPPWASVTPRVQPTLRSDVILCVGRSQLLFSFLPISFFTNWSFLLVRGLDSSQLHLIFPIYSFIALRN